MFLAKFQQVSSDKSDSDKNGNLPFIGEVIAGKATGTIYNGTMFQREQLETNVVYACDNYTDDDYPDNVQTRIITRVKSDELFPMMNQLGKGVLEISTPE